MAKRNDFKNANKKIKIPVYVSELVESPSPAVFKSYDEIVNYATNLIDNFNEKSEEEKMVLGRKDKCKVRTIRTIDYTKRAFGEIPVMLLQISEHVTGITDMFVESDEKNKLGIKIE